MILFARFALFLVGAHYSYQFFTSYWYVGSIFGAVVLAWNSHSLKTLLSFRNAAFLISSTLIYALVIFVYDKGGDADQGFYLAVAIGTVLLPIAHKVFLGTSWKRTLIAIVGLYALWYGISFLISKLELKGLAEKSINMVSIWQALYLAFLFCHGHAATRQPVAA